MYTVKGAPYVIYYQKFLRITIGWKYKQTNTNNKPKIQVKAIHLLYQETTKSNKLQSILPMLSYTD